MESKTRVDALRKEKRKGTELTRPVQLPDTTNRIHSFLTSKISLNGKKEASIITLAFPHEEMTTE